MNIKYIETKEDREQGLKIFNLIYEIYGSRVLLLSLAIAFFIIFLIEIIFQVYITGISYLGLIGTSIFIWYFGIRYHMHKKKFILKEDIVYAFDVVNDTIRIDNNIYSIKQYYAFTDYLFFIHNNGYLTVSKNNLDKKILDKYINTMEESRTWKDTLLWSIIGLIIYFFMSYVNSSLM